MATLQDEIITENIEMINKKFPGTKMERHPTGNGTRNITCRGKVWNGKKNEASAFLTGVITGANLNGLGEKIECTSMRKNSDGRYWVALSAPNRQENNIVSWDKLPTLSAFVAGYNIGKLGDFNGPMMVQQ